jgi:hypothetical protein
MAKREVQKGSSWKFGLMPLSLPGRHSAKVLSSYVINFPLSGILKFQ